MWLSIHSAQPTLKAVFGNVRRSLFLSHPVACRHIPTCNSHTLSLPQAHTMVPLHLAVLTWLCLQLTVLCLRLSVGTF